MEKGTVSDALDRLSDMPVCLLLVEAVEQLSRDDDVVEQPDVHQRAGVMELLRESDIRSTRTRISGGVVVEEDDSRRVVEQGISEDGPAVDGSRVDGSPGDLFLSDDGVT